jgi:hypothetical protein
VSKCISSRGEYSEHELGTGDMEFVCTFCFVLDEDAIKGELGRLRKRVQAVGDNLVEQHRYAEGALAGGAKGEYEYQLKGRLLALTEVHRALSPGGSNA